MNLPKLEWKTIDHSARQSTCCRYHIFYMHGMYVAHGPDGEIGSWEKSNVARHACETDAAHRPTESNRTPEQAGTDASQPSSAPAPRPHRAA